MESKRRLADDLDKRLGCMTVGQRVLLLHM